VTYIHNASKNTSLFYTSVVFWNWFLGWKQKYVCQS